LTLSGSRHLEPEAVAGICAGAATRAGMPRPEVLVAGDSGDVEMPAVSARSPSGRPDTLNASATVKGVGAASYAADVLTSLREAGWVVSSLSAEPPRLEDVFVYLTRPQGDGP